MDMSKLFKGHYKQGLNYLKQARGDYGKNFSYNDQKRARRQTISNAERLKSYSDLKRAIMSFMRITGLVNILVWKP